MHDFSHLPSAQGSVDIQVFNAQGPLDIQTWHRPRGKTMAFVALLGGGAGGGGGYGGPAGTGRGGGGGGSSGLVNKIILPLDLVSDTLYIRVPLGGQGGVPGSYGYNPSMGFVSVRPDTSFSHFVLITHGTVNQGGAPGTSSGIAGGGLVGVPAVSVPAATWGIFAGSLPGQAGGAGGAASGSPVAAVVPWSFQWICPGAGGAGCATTDYAGGGIAGNGYLPGVAGPAMPGQSGTNGYFVNRGPFQAWFSVGGTGGASNMLGAGGNGGHGGLGSGGGGGGAGLTGGTGGNGGNGLAVIVSW